MLFSSFLEDLPTITENYWNENHYFEFAKSVYRNKKQSQYIKIKNKVSISKLKTKSVYRNKKKPKYQN